jgi:outer membrane lipoprotein SlyB
MSLNKTLSALIMLGSLSGCFPPSQSSYSPTVWEQPQPVHFYYGRVVAIRPAEIAYGGIAGFGIRAGLAPGWVAGIGAGGSGPSGGFGVTALGTRLFLEAAIPNVPATEYTVMLDQGSTPPDPKSAIIIVQNVYPFERAPTLNEHVAVRAVGNSARVIADALPSDVEPRLAAGPMPIPLSGPAVAYAPPLPEGHVELFPVMIYNRYHPHAVVDVIQ